MPTSFCVLEYQQKGYKLSNVRVYGKIVDPWNSLRRRKRVDDGRGNWSLFVTLQGWKILQNHLNDELMWCLVVFQHDCMPSTFPKVKKSYSWETSFVSKEEAVYPALPALYSDWKYCGGITKQMNFNYPRRWNQCKHWAKWHQLWGKCDRLHIF